MIPFSFHYSLFPFIIRLVEARLERSPLTVDVLDVEEDYLSTELRKRFTTPHIPMWSK
jgi:hypothetical protein